MYAYILRYTLYLQLAGHKSTVRPWPFVLTPLPSYRSFHFFRFLDDLTRPQKSTAPDALRRAASPRAYKERERRAAESPAFKRRNSVKKRERRAAESPAARQARLASDKAATRRHRQALESSIAENQHMRAEHCRQAAVVAEARCARRDATHNDAFEHLVWLHSCSGSLGVMNARRLSHLKHAGASAALEIARQGVLADAQQHISLSTLDMARCVSDLDFSDVRSTIMFMLI